MENYVTFIVVSVFVIAATIYIMKARKRASYMHDLQLFEGERITYENQAADFYAVPYHGKATFTSYARRRNTQIMITDFRIIVAPRMLFSKKYLITHMLWFKPTEEATQEALRISGGLFTVGYLNFLINKKNIQVKQVKQDKKHDYLEILPEKTKSAINTQSFRLYADNLPRL